MSGAEGRWAPIPIPAGGFASNEVEARWLVETLALRFEQGLVSVGVQAKPEMRGLYDLLIVSLDAASARGRRAALQMELET